MRNLRLSALILCQLPLLGCGNAAYYIQAVSGQLDMMSRRTPISEILSDPAQADELKRRLQLVLEVRDFASDEIGLPDNGSYRSYADLHREHVVWNVVAAPEFSTDARTWCFPVAGCVAYRGYFKQAGAQAFAADLEQQGYDVFVGGVAAYSTLGRFDDPVLNTMLRWNDTRLAAVIFHELAHQLVYVKGDSSFNESFASMIEQEAVERWMQSSKRTDMLQSYLLGRERSRQFASMIIAFRQELAELYASDLEASGMRAQKRARFADLQTRYQALRKQWDGWPGYDAWFDRELNNAHLASVATYQALVPAFRLLLARHSGRLQAFYGEVKALADMQPTDRKARLEQLLEQSRDRQQPVVPN